MVIFIPRNISVGKTTDMFGRSAATKSPATVRLDDISVVAG